MNGPVVIVGTGQAGLQVALSLRDAGYLGEVTLIGDEPGLPYQRPPLSKAYLIGKIDEAGLRFRNADVLETQRITLRVPERVVAIDRAARTVRLASGATEPYEHLVLALGTRNRSLPVPGAGLDGVLSLRSLADARVLRERLPRAQDVVIVGAGFIGLEFAAVAEGSGARIHVIEAGPRVMGRAVSPEISAYFTGRHVARGASFVFNAAVSEIVGREGRVSGVRAADGALLPADLVLVGIGVVPNAELAAEAGLAVENGVVVDDHLVTIDPAISAVGDCAAHPNVHAGAVMRLESVQNAIDQARTVAARLVGRPAPYVSIPWFWSDQGSDKLQIAGLTAGCDLRIIKGDEAAGRFSVYCFGNGRLLGVESVNRPADHMGARKALLRFSPPTPQQVSREEFDLKVFLAAEPIAA